MEGANYIPHMRGFLTSIPPKSIPEDSIQHVCLKSKAARYEFASCKILPGTCYECLNNDCNKNVSPNVTLVFDFAETCPAVIQKHPAKHLPMPSQFFSAPIQPAQNVGKNKQGLFATRTTHHAELWSPGRGVQTECKFWNCQWLRPIARRPFTPQKWLLVIVRF